MCFSADTKERDLRSFRLITKILTIYVLTTSAERAAGAIFDGKNGRRQAMSIFKRSGVCATSRPEMSLIPLDAGFRSFSAGSASFLLHARVADPQPLHYQLIKIRKTLLVNERIFILKSISTFCPVVCGVV